jgi:hypothetical protein
MKYHVKTVYKTAIDAESREHAYLTAYRMMKQEPGLFLAGVEEFSVGSRKHGIFYRLLFGY